MGWFARLPPRNRIIWPTAWRNPSMSVTRTSLVALALLATPAAFAAEKADVANGKTLFEQRCGICHSTTKEGGPVMGPSMIGLVGRKAGGDENFPTYTPALKA